MTWARAAIVVLLFTIDGPRSGAAEEPSECVALVTARQYEDIGALQRAEEHYAEARKCARVEARSESLRALARIRGLREIAALQLGRTFEAAGDWEQALSHYKSLATDSDAYVSSQALEGVRRSKANIDRGWWWSFDWWAGMVTRSLAVIGFAAALWAVFRQRRSIRVRVVGASGAAAEQSAFWFGQARALLRSGSAATPAELLDLPVTSRLPYIFLPGLLDSDEDLGDVEFSGAKFSIGALVRPRVQVSIGWTGVPGLGHAYAEVESQGWIVTKRRSAISRSMEIVDGRATDDSLELLVFEVLIMAVSAYES